MTGPVALTPELLLSAYASGLFPMGDEQAPDGLYWLDPPRRGVFPLDALHVSKSLRKRLRKGGYEARVDADFIGVMRDCAAREDTWINDLILTSYKALHRRGFAHSIEIWREGRRVGGLYGVRLGAAFFGESMVSFEPDASKLALVHLVARLRTGGFALLDAQFITDHLKTLGAKEISRDDYRKQLNAAIHDNADFEKFSDDADPEAVLRAAVPGV